MSVTGRVLPDEGPLRHRILACKGAVIRSGLVGHRGGCAVRGRVQKVGRAVVWRDRMAQGDCEKLAGGIRAQKLQTLQISLTAQGTNGGTVTKETGRSDSKQEASRTRKHRSSIQVF